MNHLTLYKLGDKRISEEKNKILIAMLVGFALAMLWMRVYEFTSALLRRTVRM